MTNPLAYTMTNNTITVTHKGKVNLVRKGAPNFVNLRDALLAEDWESAVNRLTVAKAVTDWAKGRFKLEGEQVTLNGEALPTELTKRILAMAAKGEDPTRICLFWEKLSKNPSMRSVQQLWPFLNHQGIPLTKDGTFLAYKGVRSDYKDQHSGEFDNSPGQTHEMERNKISDDPNEACHYGFHVGALEYARSFASRVVVCEVDPADVVCIPYDSSAQKMRVCKYKVVGNHNGELLSSTSDDTDVDVSEGVTVPKKYAKINALSVGELLEKTTDVLRDYASNGLKIVGASKIPGGKVALIAAIERVRNG